MSQTVSFSFLSLLQFCGFKILAKLTEITFFLNLIQIFLVQGEKNLFKKNYWLQGGIFCFNCVIVR
jgi:hypothetical protein